MNKGDMGNDLNKLFQGKKQDESEGEEEGEGHNFQQKINKNAKPDKIIKNYGALKKPKDINVNEPTKQIKKGKLKKNDISETDVRRKLKEKRVVIPSRKLTKLKEKRW